MHRRNVSIAAFAVALSCCLQHALANTQGDGPVVITGATGRAGSLTYQQLKRQRAEVRAIVRNVTKAREVLGCARCDESEGIYVGDVTQPETLAGPMRGAASLVIASSSSPVCNPYPNCSFPVGGLPVQVDWQGAKSVLAAFANATAGLGHVVLISTMGTTTPEDVNDTFQHVSFYKLNFEAELMASSLPFTIVKPCGLIDTPPAETELLVGHDDDLSMTPPVIARADVARIVVAALQQPSLSEGLRFDLCSKKGTPTSDAGLPGVLQAARSHWGAHSHGSAAGSDHVLI